MPFPINEHRNLLARAEFSAEHGRNMANLELQRGSIEAGASAIQTQREGIRDTLEDRGLGDYASMFPADRRTAWNLARAGDLLRPVLEADMRNLARIRELADAAFLASASGAPGGLSPQVAGGEWIYRTAPPVGASVPVIPASGPSEAEEREDTAEETVLVLAPRPGEGY